MSNKPDEAREALRKIAEALAQDLMDSPLVEALKELQETNGTTALRGEELRRDVASLMTRLKKERLADAKRAYREETSPGRPSLSGVVNQSREVLMEKLNEILSRQPALRVAFRGRDGRQMTDRELATILEDLRELEARTAGKTDEA